LRQWIQKVRKWLQLRLLHNSLVFVLFKEGGGFLEIHLLFCAIIQQTGARHADIAGDIVEIVSVRKSITALPTNAPQESVVLQGATMTL